ncbi:hypothetical protein [Elizabethkingia meningoseptica]|uniref:hypothetical protein n=1 Tax=Elizabethkingia meningoseptica TaxID=238 RepID=UPI0038917BF5
MKKLLFGVFLLTGVSLGFAKDLPQLKSNSTGNEKTLTENKILKTIRFDSREEALNFVEKLCTDVYVDIEYIGSDDEHDYYDVTITVVQYEC